MSFVTVQGVGNAENVTVTVSGCDVSRLTDLASAYSKAVQSVIDPSAISEKTLTPSDNKMHTSNSIGYGVVTATGSYNVSGNVEYLAVGSLEGARNLDFTALIDAHRVTTEMNVVAGTKQGVVFTGGSRGGKFLATDGNNMFNTQNGNWKIDMGCGNDTVIANSGQDTVDAGKGDNFVFLGGNNNQVMSEGCDTIIGTQTGNHVTVEGGSSYLSLGNDSYVNDIAGNDTIVAGPGSTVYGGANDQITTWGNATVAAGLSDTISATGNLLLMGDNPGAQTSVTGSLVFIGGSNSGDQTVTAGQSTIFGGAGLNMKINSTSPLGDTTLGALQANESALFVAGNGSETIDASQSQFGLHAFGTNHGYSGTQVMIGGSATDTLVVGIGDATLTGGSGAANIFALRNGDAGAAYTITDFGSAAGNLVALYHYKESDLQGAVATQTHSGGNTTVTLSDNSQITFMGVDSVKSSDFTIW